MITMITQIRKMIMPILIDSSFRTTVRNLFGKRIASFLANTISFASLASLCEIIFISLCVIIFTSCEEEVNLDLPEGKTKLVVEGHIENGMPPYVILTKTISFLKSISPDQYANQFVHGASITVSDGHRTILLTEWCADNLTNAEKEILSKYFDSPAFDTTIKFNFCVYTIGSLADTSFVGEVRKRYDLTIQSEGQILTASTAIPDLLPLDSLWPEYNSNTKNDSLITLWARYRDPDTIGNFVRYFTKRNEEPFYPGYFGSVFDDRLINGTNIPFTLDRGQNKSLPPDFDNFGYFWKGDTIIVKWCAIDPAHYNFWVTAEQEFNNGGNPFGSPTVIQTNIKGGLGIWGGYATFYDTLIVPK